MSNQFIIEIFVKDELKVAFPLELNLMQIQGRSEDEVMGDVMESITIAISELEDEYDDDGED
jgi:hypothetical protein